jgi:hypothetical protein
MLVFKKNVIFIFKGENHAVRYPNKQAGGCSQKVGFSLFFSEIRDVQM